MCVVLKKSFKGGMLYEEVVCGCSSCFDGVCV